MAQHIRDLGSFESIQQVWTALPGGGMEGDYLTINGNPFAWNKFIRQWQNDTTVINNPARELQTHDGDMNIGNDARIGGNLVVIGKIINDSIKNGLSAFELAVKGGFSGSEADWLNSLIGKSAYQIWLEQAGNAGKNMTQFLAWMKDTQAIHGPKYIEDESLIDTVNDRMTLFYVPSGTSYKVVFVDEGGGTHTLANRIGDITNYAGIYDVSADNEDNGVIPRYGTLSEAIADISQAAVKGGMTIKYIDSNSGKYVQYRYVGTSIEDNDFNLEANWISDEPSSDITERTVDFTNIIEDDDIQLVDLYIKGNNNTWATESNYSHCYLVKINPSDVKIKVLSNSDYATYIAFLASNNATANTSVIYAGDSSLVTLNSNAYREIDIPDGTKYLYVNKNTASTADHTPQFLTIQASNIKVALANFEEQVDAKFDDLYVESIPNLNDYLINGKYVATTDGTTTITTNTIGSMYIIPCYGVSNIFVTGGPYQNNNIITYITFISAYSLESNTVIPVGNTIRIDSYISQEIEVPEGARYIVLGRTYTTTTDHTPSVFKTRKLSGIPELQEFSTKQEVTSISNRVGNIEDKFQFEITDDLRRITGAYINATTNKWVSNSNAIIYMKRISKGMITIKSNSNMGASFGFLSTDIIGITDDIPDFVEWSQELTVLDVDETRTLEVQNDCYLYVFQRGANATALSRFPSSIIVLTYDKINEIVKSFLSDDENKIYDYYGKRPCFKNKCAITELITLSSGMTEVSYTLHQGMALYNDYLFVYGFNRTNNTTPKLGIYNITNGNKIAEISLTGKHGTYSMPHGNVLSFGLNRQNINSIAPLLYVSQWDGERGCLVYDITETNGVYDAQLVQAIIPDSSNEGFINKFGSGQTDLVVDSVAGKIYSVGYKLGNNNGPYTPNDSTNPTMICEFNLPNIDNTIEHIIGLTDINRDFTVKSLPYRQGCHIYNNGIDSSLLIIRGNTQESRIGGIVDINNISLDKEVIVNTIPLNPFCNDNISYHEPEGIDIYNGNIVMGWRSSLKIFKIEF